MKSAKILAYVFLCVVSLTSTLSAQNWPESPKQDYHASIVECLSPSGRGSGTVVKFIKDSKDHPDYYIGLILTAAHVIGSDEDLFSISFNSGKTTIKNSVVVKNSRTIDRYNDVGLIRALIPDEVKPIEVSSEQPKIGDTVELAGYGAGAMRHWNAVYGGSILNNDGFIVLSWAIQGDSGGPIIYNGKVIGVICFGSAVARYSSRRLLISPIHCSSAGRAAQFIKAYSA